MHHSPRKVATQSSRGRTNIPPPPEFYEEVFIAGVRAGAAVRSSQNIQLLSDGDDTDRVSTPREANQPQGEPEPEMPGRTDPSESEQTSRTNGGESDVETLQFNQEDGSNYPDHTDTDPYEDPTDSHADVEQRADIEQIEVEDSLDESTAVEGPVVIPEPASTIIETPPAATETASAASQEPIIIEESNPKESTPPRPMGRMDAFTGSTGGWSNPLKNPIQPIIGTTLPLKKQTPAEPQEGQAPEMQSHSMSSESAPPQTTAS